MAFEPSQANPNDPVLARMPDESSEDSFAQVVNRAWERLWEKKRELSLQHIKELEQDLLVLEQELDQFIARGGSLPDSEPGQ